MKINNACIIYEKITVCIEEPCKYTRAQFVYDHFRKQLRAKSADYSLVSSNTDTTWTEMKATIII